MSSNLTGTWTPEKLNLLRTEWAAGASASKIALLIGCSRSAILGKIRRLGIPVRPKPDKPQKPQLSWTGLPKRKRAARKPKPYEPLNLTFRELKPGFSQCRFIIGEPNGADTIYCGLPVERSSYCAHCYAITNTSRRHYDRAEAELLVRRMARARKVVAA